MARATEPQIAFPPTSPIHHSLYRMYPTQTLSRYLLKAFGMKSCPYRKCQKIANGSE